MYSYVNSERTEGKTDAEQTWTAPSKKLETAYPKGETLGQIFGFGGATSNDVYVQKKKGEADEFCDQLIADLAQCGLVDSSLYKSLTADLSKVADPEVKPLPDVHPKIQEIFYSRGLITLQKIFGM